MQDKRLYKNFDASVDFHFSTTTFILHSNALEILR